MTGAHLGSNRVAAVAVALVGLGIIALGITVSTKFSHLIGATDDARYALSAGGALIIILKALLPFVLFVAWQQHRWVLFSLSALGLTASCVFTLATVYGYSAAQRSVTERESTSRTQLEQRIQKLGDPRPASVVEAAIAAASADARKALRVELANAREKERLQNELKSLPVRPDAEAQISGLHQLLGVDPDTIRAVIQGVGSICLELGEMICLFGASVLWRREDAPPPEAAKQPTPQEKPADTVVVQHPAASPAQRRQRTTASTWLVTYLEAAPPGVTLKVAYDDYLAEWKRARRRPTDLFRFKRVFDEATAPATFRKAA